MNIFLTNNDLNMTAFYFEVNDVVSTAHAPAYFWKFLFQKNKERVIRISKPRDLEVYGTMICIEMTSKSFEIGMNFTFGKAYPTRGTVGRSQKEKW